MSILYILHVFLLYVKQNAPNMGIHFTPIEKDEWVPFHHLGRLILKCIRAIMKRFHSLFFMKTKRHHKKNFICPFYLAAIVVILIASLASLQKAEPPMTVHQAGPRLTESECQTVKYRYFTGEYILGTRRKSLESPEKIEAEVDSCKKNFSNLWKRIPSPRQCAAVNFYIAKKRLSDMVSKRRTTEEFASICAAKLRKAKKCALIKKYYTQGVLTDTINKGEKNLDWIDVVSCKDAGVRFPKK